MTPPITIDSAVSVANYLSLGNVVGKLFGGLFADKDYPWARIDIFVNHGRVFLHNVQTLDGQSRAQWTSLGNVLKRQIEAQLAQLPKKTAKGISVAVQAIGYGSGRKSSSLGSGWFICDDTCGFADGAVKSGIASQSEAVSEFYKLMDTRLIGAPRGLKLFTASGKAGTPKVDFTPAIKDGVVEADTGVTKLLDNLEKRLEAKISNVVQIKDEFLQDALASIDNTVEALIGGGRSVLDDAIGSVTGLIDSAIGKTGAYSNEVFERIATAAEIAIAAQTFVDTRLTESIANHAADVFDKATDVLDAIEAVQRVGIGAVIDEAEATIRGLTSVLTGSIEGVVSAADGIEDVVSGFNINRVADGLERISDSINDSALDYADALTGALPGNVVETFRAAGKAIALDPNEVNSLEQFLFNAADAFELDSETCKDRFAKANDPENFADNFIRFVANVLAALMFPLSIAQARASGCLQHWAQSNPYLMLPPAESTIAEYRGLLGHDEAIRNIKGIGLAEADAERIIETARPLPDEGIVLGMWLRGLLSEDDTNRTFKGKGWTPEWTAKLKAHAFFIPPAQDLITMAVREVFNKEIAESFGQFDDFPDEFGKWAGAQGISEDWAKNYWAAHWALPSIQMGFEMLHRRVIDETKLKQLMQALDIMPGWRDELIQISFSPYTRVDIRRMHKVGVLSDEEVFGAYLDLGYNDERAGKLREFTKRLNDTDDDLFSDIANNLSRSNILGFYDDGIIPKSAARLLLINSGYNVLTSELFIESVDLDRERKERKADINIVLDEVRLGALSIDEARARLDSLGLETRERDLAILDAERIAKGNIKVPGKADLDKFLKAGLLSESQYRTWMMRQGWSDAWVSMYIGLMGE